MASQPHGSAPTFTVQYVPRTKTSELNGSRSPAGARHGIKTNYEQPSPGGNSMGRASIESYSPSGYAGSVSEVSSVTGSVASMALPRQTLEVSRWPYTSRYESGDSGNYSRQARSYASSTTSYTETDLDSVAGGESRSYPVSGDERYKGELFQPNAPQPAPRTLIVKSEVRRMYGEVHPRNLPSEDLPSSGDELESTASTNDSAAPSFADVPKVRPRASLRRQKLSEANSAFISDDESISSQIDKPKGILKNPSTDISDAESLAKSNFSRSGSRRSVRFQHRDKSKDLPKKTINYAELDSDDGKKKRKKSSSSDPFSQIAPVSIKPARNDPKRSSGSSKRGSQRGSQKGRQNRSSSSDRSRPKDRNGSTNRSRSASLGNQRRSPSAERKGNGITPKPRDEYKSAVSEDEVKIKMSSEPKKSSMMGEIIRQNEPSNRSRRDNQKICKWCLIIGVPVTLIIIAIVIVVIVFTGS